MPAAEDEEGTYSWLIPAIIGGLTLWVAYRQYQRVSSRQQLRAGPPVFPGRVVARDGRPSGGPLGGVQGAALNTHVGDETLDMALKRVRARAGLPRRETRNMSTVEERLAEIGRLIHDGSRDDDIKAAAQAVLTRKCGDRWCVDPKDYAGESDAIYTAVVDPKSPIAMRYTLDHPVVDEFGSAQRGLRMRSGDCDDLVIYYGALVSSIGHRPELVIMQAKGADNWSHILLREPVNLDDGTGAGGAEYRYMDPSMQFGNGWMPPGYAPPGLEAALAGYPGSGITQRAQAFRIFP